MTHIQIKPELGHRHPLSGIVREMREIFREMGFVFAEGPEVETEVNNFDRLNVPKDHPSRDMQDTFWFKDEDVPEPTVLRTHTSAVQIRFMENNKPPFRMICSGKVFRNEATDATHEAQFYQLEGLVVGEDVNLAHLKGLLEKFFLSFFGDSVEMRLRPSYFPFVEPGLEVDMRINSDKISKSLRGRWIEALGAGMVHPNVLRDSGIDPEKYSGFAFGIGIDRMAVMKYGIDDIRHLYSGDLRLVNQF